MVVVAVLVGETFSLLTGYGLVLHMFVPLGALFSIERLELGSFLTSLRVILEPICQHVLFVIRFCGGVGEILYHSRKA